MNEMGRGKKDEGETRLIHDSDVVRQGFLKRMKVRPTYPFCVHGFPATLANLRPRGLREATRDR
jgi:hypothetical protein